MRPPTTREEIDAAGEHPLFDLFSELELRMRRDDLVVSVAGGHRLGRATWTATARVRATGGAVETGTGPSFADALIALAQNLSAQREAG